MDAERNKGEGGRGKGETAHLENIEKVEASRLDIDENLTLLEDRVWDCLNSHLIDRGQRLFNENSPHGVSRVGVL